MKLSAKSREKMQSFFREYFHDNTLNLPPIEIHTGFWAKLITRALKIEGITIGKHIFLLPRVIDRQEKHNIAPKGLIVHEATHVLQYARQGFGGFIGRYLLGYWRNLRTKPSWNNESRWAAYREIPHEIEACTAADAFFEWESKNAMKLSED